MQNLDTQDLQMTIQMRFQFRYNDPRLKFKNVDSNSTEAIVGEDLEKSLWVPHVFFVNERQKRKMKNFQDQETPTADQ